MNKTIRYLGNIFTPIVLVNILAYFNSLITGFVNVHYKFYYGCFVIWPFVWATICILVLIPVSKSNRQKRSLYNAITLGAGILLLYIPVVAYMGNIGFINRLMSYFDDSLNTVSMPVVGIFTCAYIYLIIKNLGSE